MDIQQVFDIMLEAEQQMSELAQKSKEVKPGDLGLDWRAGQCLWVVNGGILVLENYDRNLQYYGGFEYVDKDYRFQVGKWVFYMAEDERVQGCLDYLNEKEKAA